jgi:lysophospholipase L1-like esterase/2-polyprenyl-3-methyl-5-hydroxy-6-metoxy-1,4-benzoquinol methylase
VAFIREEFLDGGGAEKGEVITRANSAPTPFADTAPKRQLAAAKFRTWERAVDHLVAVIEQCFERRKGTVASASRHGIEHSDIAFTESLQAPFTEKQDANLIELRTRQELRELYSFADSPEAYAAHYAKHCGIYYNSFEDKVIGEDVSSTSRFQGVAALVAQEIGIAGNELRVLDYGCAHGHYMMPLAKSFPSCRFTGIDVSERAIGAALKWAQRDNITNVELRLGSQEALKDIGTLCPLVYDEESMQYEGSAAVAKRSHRDLFDVILAGEVVEHVPDWRQLLEDFRGVLKPGGLLIVTTPYGRWEWSGTEAFREAREHLHHFERQDIVDICGRNEVQIFYAPASADKTGKGLGSYVCGVLNRGVHGDTAHGVLRRAEEVLQRRPATIVLMIGVNDVLNGSSATSVAEHVEHFLELARTTSPKTKVVLVSTLPVHEERIDTPGANAQIRALNDVLRRAALAAGQPFVDLHAEFADEVGNLRAELTSDGLHLSPLAYVKWRAALPPFALEAASQ